VAHRGASGRPGYSLPTRRRPGVVLAAAPASQDGRPRSVVARAGVAPRRPAPGLTALQRRAHPRRWLLHDGSVSTEDRVSGLLILLYAQWTSTIGRLTLDHVTITEDAVVLHLGAEPITLPDPLDTLVTGLVQQRRSHPVTGTLGSCPWLFPGEHPGQHISSKQLNDRLRRLGLRPGPGPLHRLVPARHRPTGRGRGPAARHPHLQRNLVAARQPR
jgi:hypothetical protein